MKRHAVTLVELLVVILIMLMITAIVIPVVAPAIAGRQVREGARMVDVFIAGAKTRAQQTGHSVGVSFELTPGNLSTCQVMKYCEVPDPYAGDFINSTISVVNGRGWFGPFVGGDIGWYGLVRPGDLVRANYHAKALRLYAGEPYIDANLNGDWDTGESFKDLDGNNTWTGPQPGVLNKDGYFVKGPNASYPDWCFAPADPAEAYIDVTSGGSILLAPGTSVSFQIELRPTLMQAGALTLPGDVAIDMGTLDNSGSSPVVHPGSGIDGFGDGTCFLPNNTNTVPPANSRVIVTFNPVGAVDMVYFSPWNGNTSAPGWGLWGGNYVTSPIYFVVGRASKVGGDTSVQTGEPVYNFQDAESLIVAIEPLTGRVVTEHTYQPTLTDPISQQLSQSRAMARESTSMETR